MAGLLVFYFLYHPEPQIAVSLGQVQDTKGCTKWAPSEGVYFGGGILCTSMIHSAVSPQGSAVGVTFASSWLAAQ